MAVHSFIPVSGFGFGPPPHAPGLVQNRNLPPVGFLKRSKYEGFSSGVNTDADDPRRLLMRTFRLLSQPDISCANLTYEKT